MEESAQVDRAAGDRIPPFEHPPRRTLEGWGTLRSLEGWGTLLPRAFFEAPPELAAPRLLGKVLAHRTGSLVLAGRIVEAEAYLGPHNDPPDPAAHAHGGPTPRNSVLFGPPGHAYVYAIYGRYFCMNVSCEVEGRAGCVLLRALEPLGGADGAEVAQMIRNRGLAHGGRSESRLVRQLASGPGRLCQALGITRLRHNGLDLAYPASPLQIRDDGYAVTEVLATARIGIHEAVDWPLRFVLPGNRCVSGAKNAIGKRVTLSVEFD
jgi:DNA-3-methyladenine glycosylase